MRVLVTGATGFIGSRLVRHHADHDDEVRVLTRRRLEGRLLKRVTAYRGDLATLTLGQLSAAVDGVDVLYHCAGEIRDQHVMDQVNVRGTQTLLEAARGRVGHFVHLSSVGVYGPLASGEVDETAPHAPSGEYERTKSAADRIALAAHGDGLVVSVLRPSIVIGEEMPGNFLRQMIRMIRRRLFFFIGAPGASVNYIHVDDVIDALALCGSHPAAAGRAFNVSDWCTLEEAVDAIGGALGFSPRRLRLPEAPIRAITRPFSGVRGFPLTPSRLDALVNRARYSTRSIEELGYAPTERLTRRLAHLTQAWAELDT